MGSNLDQDRVVHVDIENHFFSYYANPNTKKAFPISILRSVFILIHLFIIGLEKDFDVCLDAVDVWYQDQGTILKMNISNFIY